MEYYKSDGRGRDTYILYNNGGFMNPQKMYIIKKKYTLAASNLRTCKPINSNYRSKKNNYNPDGSGRDTYIKYNEGGYK